MPPIRPRYSDEAASQADALMQHYEALGRIEAVSNLARSLEEAEQRIVMTPGAGLSAPRPYPSLARLSRRWIKAGPYWIAYLDENPPMILGVFYETADIPNRL